jgi:hypothetical protein
MKEALHSTLILVLWIDENAVHVTVLFPDGSSTASTVSEYPFQEGSSLNTVGINYKTLKAAAAPKHLRELETIAPPGS